MSYHMTVNNSHMKVIILVPIYIAYRKWVSELDNTYLALLKHNFSSKHEQLPIFFFLNMHHITLQLSVQKGSISFHTDFFFVSLTVCHLLKYILLRIKPFLDSTRQLLWVIISRKDDYRRNHNDMIVIWKMIFNCILLI